MLGYGGRPHNVEGPTGEHGLLKRDGVGYGSWVRVESSGKRKCFLPIGIFPGSTGCSPDFGLGGVLDFESCQGILSKETVCLAVWESVGCSASSQGDLTTDTALVDRSLQVVFYTAD